jgi:hypothetical protein
MGAGFQTDLGCAPPQLRQCLFHITEMPVSYQNPLPPPPPLPPPLDPPPPDPDELGLDDMLLAAALDMLLMLCEKLDALNGPVPPTYHCGGSR